MTLNSGLYWISRFDVPDVKPTIWKTLLQDKVILFKIMLFSVFICTAYFTDYRNTVIYN